MNETLKDNTSELTWRQKINYNTVTALIFIVLWTVMFFIVPYQIQKPKLFLGRSLMGLQPTLFPRLATLGLIGLNIWYLIISFRLEEKNLFKELKKENFFKVIASLIVFIAYALLFEPLGFVLSSFLVVASLSTYYGNRNIIIGLLVSLGVPLVIYYIFTHLLKVSLPEFPFF